jgi:hypothetical protein
MVVIRMGRKRSRQASKMASRALLLPLAPLRRQGEIDHHDGVLLDDADQQDDADQRDDAELGVGEHERQQRAHAGRGQRERES